MFIGKMFNRYTEKCSKKSLKNVNHVFEIFNVYNFFIAYPKLYHMYKHVDIKIFFEKNVQVYTKCILCVKKVRH